MNDTKIFHEQLLIAALSGFIAISWMDRLLASDVGSTTPSATKPAVEIVSAAKVNWVQLNPARGSNSPQAATLWGDLKGRVATGFLAKFIDGFSSPPHIHNATYRAVVIDGYIHNDDPKAADMWMGPGSFWTQPKGETHITAARGATNVALVEIDQGPYLVRPPEEAFESGEKAINLDASNIVWVAMPSVSGRASEVKITYLWGNPEDGFSYGSFLKLPANFTGKISNRGSNFRAVVIKGEPNYLSTERKTLTPGSYFGVKAESEHPISSDGRLETILYVRTNGRYSVIDARR